MRIRLPKTEKVERTLKLRLFIGHLIAAADKLKSEANKLRTKYNIY